MKNYLPEMKMKKPMFTVALLIFLVSMTGCSYAGNNNSANNNTGFVNYEIGSYDSADTAILVKKNIGEDTLTFQNLETGKQYTLNFDGTTNVTDKYGEAMSMEQLEEGEIVDLTFLKINKQLASISLSADTWTYSEVESFELGEGSKTLTIGKDVYKINSNAVLVSDGEIIELMDLNARDTIKIQGIDHNIYSIIVEKGHGYLRLANAEYFIGGWIEIGTIIVPVTENMLLTIPEGTHSVLITNEGSGGEKEVTIVRNQETELDVSDLQGEEKKEGGIIFTLNPASAQIYIDGEVVDPSSKVVLEYGIHQMIITASGYKTISQYIKVGQELASIDIAMEVETVSDNEATVSTNAVSGNTTTSGNGTVSGNTTGTTTSAAQNTGTTSQVSGNAAQSTASTASNGTYSVHIDSPEGVEVYVDGTYVGIAPTSFKKEKGTYVISLRKTGYQTRSYTISVDDQQKDISYSFSALSSISN